MSRRALARAGLALALAAIIGLGLVTVWLTRPIDCLTIRRIDGTGHESGVRAGDGSGHRPAGALRRLVALPPGSGFEVAWRHSVEEETWVESFVNHDHAIRLVATRFKTFGAGVPDHAGKRTRLVDGWVVMSAIDRPMTDLVYQAAAAERYRLRIADGPWRALSHPGQAPLLAFAIAPRRRAVVLWHRVFDAY